MHELVDASIPLRWLHIPKTGSTFANTMYHYGCPKVPGNVFLPTWKDCAKTKFCEPSALESYYPRRFPPNIWCNKLILPFVGHDPVTEGLWNITATIFREPQARLCSHYRFSLLHGRVKPWAKVEKMPRLASMRVRGKMLTFKEFGIKYRSLKGCQTKMLFGFFCNSRISKEVHSRLLCRL